MGRLSKKFLAQKDPGIILPRMKKMKETAPTEAVDVIRE
jgi:hypothetical protein